MREVGKTQSGIGFPDAEQGGTEGVPFYKVSDMNKPGNEHEMVNANNYVNYEQLSRKKWKIIETVPAVIFAKVGAAIMLNRKRLVTSPFLIDNNTMAYVFDGSWNIDFGKTLFETINLPRYAQVGALPSYNGSDIESIEVTLPNKGEQVKLGAFFKSLDDTIALHQRKLDKLQELKKAALQALFPQKNETEPKVRFANLNGLWKRCKLGELGEIVGGGTPNTNIKEYWDGNINWYSPVEIGNDTYVYESKKKITELGLQKSSAKKLPANKTILFTSRAGIGDMAILGSDGATNQGFQSIIVKGNNDVYFLYSYGNKIKSKAIKYASGSTFLEISGQELSKIQLKVPSLIEQQKLGIFFKKIDNTIVLHRKRFKKLQVLKKSLLTKMLI